MSDDIESLLFCDLAGDELTVGLESRDDIDICIILGHCASGLDGSTVDHEGWSIDSSHGHHHSGHILVAARDGDVRIVPLPTHDRLDTVCDQISGLQRVSHAGGAHGHAVRDPNGVELVSN